MTESIVIAAARQCRGNQTPAAFTQITPTRTDDGNLVAYLAGRRFPVSAEQLWGAIGAVFGSWMAEKVLPAAP